MLSSVSLRLYSLLFLEDHRGNSPKCLISDVITSDPTSESEETIESRNKDRQGGHSQPAHYITATGSVSCSLEGGPGRREEGGGLINECYWVVESLCPHSPSCHRRTQWLHQFVAIITSIAKNGGRRGGGY